MEEIAQVYARSLFEVASEQGKVERVRDELGAFTDFLDRHRDVATFFFSPYFSNQEKKDGLSKAIDDADPTTVNFLHLLIDKHRMPAIFRLRREFDRLWAEANRRLPVSITSAIALPPEMIEQITGRIGEATGEQVEATSIVDPEILGGIVVRAGNTILDASIRNRLEHLKTQVARA